MLNGVEPPLLIIIYCICLNTIFWSILRGSLESDLEGIDFMGSGVEVL